MRPDRNGTGDVEIADPDGFTSSKRLKQIYRAKEDLRKMRIEAAKARNKPSNTIRSKMQAVQYYRAGVEAYLLEVDTLLQQHDPGPKLYHEREFGTMDIRPPGEWVQKRGYYESKDIEIRPNVPLQVEDIPDPKEVPVVGLKWLFEHDTPLVREFEFESSGYRMETITRSNSAVLKWVTLNKMVTAINTFLNKIGIGLKVEDGGEWTI
jgi:hypothetical protein